MPATVKVRVSPAGQTRIEVEGVQGTSCESVTEVLELHLGGGGKKETKPEYHMPATGNVGAQLTF